MIYIEKVAVELAGINKVNQEFELGDLTIFIGRANSYKTRILRAIFDPLNNIFVNNKSFETFKSECVKKRFILNNNIRKAFAPAYVPSLRPSMVSREGLGVKLAKGTNALKAIDPTIKDTGTNIIEFLNDETRPISEQGSGVHNKLQILDKLHDKNNIVIIDEPEISQFPYGKIEILKNIVAELRTKQIVFATHDPTLINKYLIKKLMNSASYKVVIYSFSGTCFKKVDFSTDWNPETHVGYLSQTYSGKPVHMILEGETDFYAFQALLIKYCIHNKIHNFPRFINKISLSQIGGGQWEVNIHHLPLPEYYDVLVLLDGEHKDNLKSLEGDSKFNLTDSLDNVSDNKINVLTLKSQKIEDVFERIFGEKFSNKPLGIANKVWSLSEEEFNKMDWKDEDLKLIKESIEWCLKKAGWLKAEAPEK